MGNRPDMILRSNGIYSDDGALRFANAPYIYSILLFNLAGDNFDTDADRSYSHLGWF
jgi:hypothetical protein